MCVLLLRYDILSRLEKKGRSVGLCCRHRLFFLGKKNKKCGCLFVRLAGLSKADAAQEASLDNLVRSRPPARVRKKEETGTFSLAHRLFFPGWKKRKKGRRTCRRQRAHRCAARRRRSRSSPRPSPGTIFSLPSDTSPLYFLNQKKKRNEKGLVEGGAVGQALTFFVTHPALCL